MSLGFIVCCSYTNVFANSWELFTLIPWRRYSMETLSASLAICEGNQLKTGEFPSQRSGNASFDVFFDVSLNKRLNGPSSSWWFETLWRSLWRHCNVSEMLHVVQSYGIVPRKCHFDWLHRTLLICCMNIVSDMDDTDIDDGTGHVTINTFTRWGRVTRIRVSKLTIIGSDNGLSHGRR